MTWAITKKAINSDLSTPLNSKIGRVQVDGGFDGAVLGGCEVDGDKVVLSDILETITQDTGVGSTSPIFGDAGVGQRLNSTFTANLQQINWVDVYILTKSGTPNALRMTIYDETTDTVLSTTNEPQENITAGQMNRITPASPVSITKGNIIQIRFDQNGGGSEAAEYYIAITGSGNVQTNAFQITTSNLWSSKSDSTDSDIRYAISINDDFLLGTVTQTISPSDLYQFEQIFFKTVTDANSSISCRILDSLDNELIPSVNDGGLLSSIDTTEHKTIKAEWTLERDTVLDDSPELHMPFWTWTGTVSVIKSIQRGTTAYPAGSETTNVTISRVDLNKSNVSLSYTTSSGVAQNIDLVLTSATNLRIRNNVSNTIAGGQISWEVIEYV